MFGKQKLAVLMEARVHRIEELRVLASHLVPTPVPSVAAPWKVANLALSGSGVLAIMQAGAVAELRASGYAFPNIAGTSGGSIVATMVAAGMSDTEIFAAVGSIDYTAIQHPAHWYVRRLGIVGKIMSEALDVGIYDQSYLQALVTQHLTELGVVTWGDLRAKIRAGKASNLAVVSVVEEEYETAVFPNVLETEVGLPSDSQPISFAVMASTAIVNGFVPPTITGPDGRQWHFIDGGFADNLPYDVAEAMDPERRYRTIGVDVERPREVVPYPNRNPLRFIKVNFARGTRGTSANNQALRSTRLVNDNTVVCDSQGVSADDYGLTVADVQRLYMMGRANARQWITADELSRGNGKATPAQSPAGTAVQLPQGGGSFPPSAPSPAPRHPEAPRERHIV